MFNPFKKYVKHKFQLENAKIGVPIFGKLGKNE